MSSFFLIQNAITLLMQRLLTDSFTVIPEEGSRGAIVVIHGHDEAQWILTTGKHKHKRT